MKQRYFFLSPVLLAVLALLASCQKNLVQSEAVDSDLISFSPLLSIENDESKGSMIAGSDYGNRDFWTACWLYQGDNQFPYTKVKQFTHATGSKHTYWSTVDASDKIVEYFWKKASGEFENRYFHAYTNIPATDGAAVMKSESWGSQDLYYHVDKVPTTDLQTDILLGHYHGKGLTPEQAGKTGDGWVGHFAEITFRHPLAAVFFKKGSITGWTSGDKIKSIKIEGVYKDGRFNDDGSNTSWSKTDDLSLLPTGSTTVSMSNDSGLSVGSGDVIGDTFFLIPQNFANQSITIKATIVLGGITYTDVKCTVNTGEWLAGYYYSYTINFASSPMEGITVSLDEWGNVESTAGNNYFIADYK